MKKMKLIIDSNYLNHCLLVNTIKCINNDLYDVIFSTTNNNIIYKLSIKFKLFMKTFKFYKVKYFNMENLDIKYIKDNNIFIYCSKNTDDLYKAIGLQVSCCCDIESLSDIIKERKYYIV